jgi:hypothetical protein
MHVMGPTAKLSPANQHMRRDLIFVEEASMAAGAYLRTSSLSLFNSSSTILSLNFASGPSPA